MKKTLLLLTFAIGMQSAPVHSNPTNQNERKAECTATAFASFGLSVFAGYMTICSKLDAITPVTAFYAVVSGFIGVQGAKRALYGKSPQSNENMNATRGQEIVENYTLDHDESNVIEGKRVLQSFTYKHDDTYVNYGKNAIKVT